MRTLSLVGLMVLLLCPSALRAQFVYGTTGLLHMPTGEMQRDKGSPDKPGGLSIQLCKSEKKEFYIRYSS